MKLLSSQKHASSLGILRILIGVFALLNFHDFHTYFKNSLSHSSFFFTYDFFDWIGMLQPEQVNIFFAIAYVAAVLLILGVAYRISASIAFLCYTYILLTDIGHYNNHYYLMSILLLFLCITNGHYWGAIGSKKHEGKLVPYWQINVFKWQLVAVYFFGGIAKLDRDWLSGYPMRYWLYNKSLNAPGFVADFLKSEFATYFFSWSGLLFDLLIGFLLLSKKWRRFALIPLVFFHFTNHFLWQIGTFPWMMISVSIIFFAPDLPQRCWEMIKTSPSAFIQRCVQFLKPIAFWNWLFPREKNSSEPEVPRQPVAKAVMVFLVCWGILQLFLPIRQYFYKGETAWTGQGQLFAWRMMLIDEESAIRITFQDPSTGQFLNVDLAQYLNPSQIFRVGKSPRHLLKFIHFLRDELQSKGHIEHPVIHLEFYKSVNNRTPELLNNTALNYAIVEQNIFESADWINDWSSVAEDPSNDPAKVDAWKKFLNDHPHQYLND